MTVRKNPFSLRAGFPPRPRKTRSALGLGKRSLSGRFSHPGIAQVNSALRSAQENVPCRAGFPHRHSTSKLGSALGLSKTFISCRFSRLGIAQASLALRSAYRKRWVASQNNLIPPPHVRP